MKLPAWLTMPGGAQQLIWPLIMISVSFLFHFPRNDRKTRTRDACVFARQKQNPTNPHSYHHRPCADQPQNTIQPRPTSAAKHTQKKHQPAKTAFQSSATRCADCAWDFCCGDGRGRTSRIQPQGDCAKRVWGLFQRPCWRVCRSTRRVVLRSMMTSGIVLSIQLKIHYEGAGLILWCVWKSAI